MGWNDRRYSPWLLNQEESLRKRQDTAQRAMVLICCLVALIEALFPWQDVTPGVPAWMHITVAALLLPVLHFLSQGDQRRKQQAFNLAMSDRGRRLLFLDPYLEPEEFALSERLHGAHLLPLARQIDTALKAGGSTSLNHRVDFYFRALPSPVHEGDRMGWLSGLHPANFAAWAFAISICWLTLPGIGMKLGNSDGLSFLGLLLPLYLFASRANTRFAYEHSLYSWLRLG